MKRKEIDELKIKSPEELRGLVSELKEKLRVLKFDLLAGKVKNVREIKAVKKNIARALTFIKQAK